MMGVNGFMANWVQAFLNTITHYFTTENTEKG